MTNLTSTASLSFVCMLLILMTILINFIHPALIILLMLSYSMLLCMNLGSWKLSYIFPMLFFLIMVSGLLIIFLYFSSLISNEKSWTPNFLMTLLITILISPIMLKLIKLNYMLQFTHPGNLPINTTPLMLPQPWINNQSMILMFQTPPFFLTMISMTYLLTNLISIIKITSPKMKSMRKMV